MISPKSWSLYSGEAPIEVNVQCFLQIEASLGGSPSSEYSPRLVEVWWTYTRRGVASNLPFACSEGRITGLLMPSLWVDVYPDHCSCSQSSRTNLTTASTSWLQPFPMCAHSCSLSVSCTVRGWFSAVLSTRITKASGAQYCWKSSTLENHSALA